MSREWDSVLEGFWPAPLSGVHTKLAADSARRRAQALEQQRKAARPTATRPSTAHGARRSRAVRGGLEYLFASAATKPELPALPGGEPLQDRSSQRLFVAREKHPWPKAARQPQSCADQRRFLPPSTSFSVLQEAGRSGASNTAAQPWVCAVLSLVGQPQCCSHPPELLRPARHPACVRKGHSSCFK